MFKNRNLIQDVQNVNILKKKQKACNSSADLLLKYGFQAAINESLLLTLASFLLRPTVGS